MCGVEIMSPRFVPPVNITHAKLEQSHFISCDPWETRPTRHGPISANYEVEKKTTNSDGCCQNQEAGIHCLTRSNVCG